MQPITAENLSRLVFEIFPPSAVAQAENLIRQQRVLGLDVDRIDDGWQIQARVLGPSSKLVVVDLELYSEDDESLDLDQLCSCRKGGRCEHGAAVLLFVASEPKRWFGPGPNSSLDANRPLPPPAKSTPPTTASPPASLSKPTSAALDPRFLQWLGELRRAAQPAIDAPTRSTTKVADQLLYVLRLQQDRLLVLPFIGCPVPKRRAWNRVRSIHWSQLFADGLAAAFLDPEDRHLIRELVLIQGKGIPWELELKGPHGAAILPRLLATRRCFWNSAAKGQSPLAAGEPRPGRLSWKLRPDGVQTPALEIEPPASLTLPLEPLWYLDPEVPSCGPIQTSHPFAVTASWLKAPAIQPDQATDVARAFEDQTAPWAMPAPKALLVEQIHDAVPVPCLTLRSTTLRPNRRASLWEINPAPETVSIAQLSFRYGADSVDSGSSLTFVTETTENGLRRIYRNPKAERGFFARLKDLGLLPASDALPYCTLDRYRTALTAFPSTSWFHFLQESVPALRAEGWHIVEDPTFEWRVVIPDDWFAQAAPSRQHDGAAEDWFAIELGVVVNGEQINLLPVLLDLLRANPHALDAQQASTPGQPGIPLRLPDGRTLFFPADRARAVHAVLLDLFAEKKLSGKGSLRLDRLRTAQLAGDTNWRWLGSSELRALGDRLRDFKGIQRVTSPGGLQTELRPYQLEGLSWLQFLREFDLAGVLADDMGLGKTVQTLAHLLIEHEAGRADRPSLVIAPTSLMTNWRQEAERFAPSLRVLVLHGFDRRDHFEDIPNHHLILTTYPLLPRDLPFLQKHSFHCLILDEAQFIKNPKTAAAQAAVQLDARHRFCLTGTPVENHLGELWSLFHFLLPGFLGDELTFNRVFRRPIEKYEDRDRRRLLARRVAPFLLRRRKEEVAPELPPKSEILQNIELAEAQRDLYESVRLAMHTRVREEVARKGLSRAHIVILDALLKLRQICCHPQLLKLPAARDVHESAKLERLFELLPPLLEEGRRVLLFSQFTSMLSLIEEDLNRRSMPYVLLTGDTQDRATPVRRFQKGDVPLFLISLKAGGTGLNLTAADTVIHYDPWWNPAVENQATDRAHRIGQEKHVFVYKLLTVGTVEEKIASLQNRKRDLVAGLLDPDRPDKLALSIEDLDDLFSPIGQA